MSFWRDRSVLVTGASGFVGSNLTKALLKEGAKVYGFSTKGTKASKKILQESGSVEDFDLINKIIRRNKIDIIYHLAAQPIVEIGQRTPIKTLEVNIRGTWNVLEAARRNRVKKIIILSTTHVYGGNEKLPYKEEYFPQPTRPYETSKACADLLAQSYYLTFGLQVDIPRFVNLYGPGDFNFGRIVPKVIKTILSKQNPKIWNKGAVRDFLFIEDAIEALLLLGEKKNTDKKSNRIFNFGSGNPISIADLVKKIIKISKLKNIKLEFESVPEERETEIVKQYVSINKAKKVLGWSPKTSLDEGITKTLEWYRGVLGRER